MSWLHELAGKAETILTKIDQNAATVLQIQNRQTTEHDDVELIEPLLEVRSNAEPKLDNRSIPPIKSNANKSLSLVGKPTRNVIRPNSSFSSDRTIFTDGDVEEGSVKSDKQYSSRRSSIGSKKGGIIIDLDTHISENHDASMSDYSIGKELAEAKILLAEVKTERDELKIELDTVQCQHSSCDAEVRLKELELVYQDLVDQKNELLIKHSLVEESNAKYIKSISELESIISKHIQNDHELHQKLEMSHLETKNATAELQRYRVRAHATLQLKEKVIEQLKQNLSTSTSGDDSNENINSEQLMLIELEQIKNERFNLQEEMSALKDKYEQSKMLWEGMENKLKKSSLALEMRIDELQVQLNLKTTKLLQMEDDLNIKQKELLSSRDELVKQKTSFAIKLHERDTEIAKLRSRTNVSLTSPSADLEIRLNSLTQSLVQKQSSLESVTAERNALRLQLEKLDAQYRSTVTQIRQQRTSYLSGNETDDAKSQLPNFMVENPFDNNVARRVKRAYSSLDSVGIRLGIFLRRYPLIRILVIVYVAILHLWVMFVLLSSTPAV